MNQFFARRSKQIKGLQIRVLISCWNLHFMRFIYRYIHFYCTIAYF